MQIDLDPRGRKVVIFGDRATTRQALRRFLHAGGTVTLVLDGPLPDPADRIDTVRYAPRPAPSDTAGLLRLIGPAWLIVDVGLPSAFRERIRELASHLHVLIVTEEPAPREGSVTLVGGGPGTTSLLTLEACAALRQADVVFYDRLAATDDLAELAAGSRTDRCRQVPVSPSGGPGLDRGPDDQPRPPGRVGGPAQRRRSVRARSWRGGDAGLRPGRGGRPRRPGHLQRAVGAGGLRHPGHPPRGQQGLHGDLRSCPAGARTSWRLWSGSAPPS